MKLEDFLTPEVAKRMMLIDRLRKLIVDGEQMLQQPRSYEERDKILRALSGVRVALPKVIADLETFA